MENLHNFFKSLFARERNIKNQLKYICENDICWQSSEYVC